MQDSDGVPDYDERLSPPLWWWPAGLAAVGALAYVVPRGEALHDVNLLGWELGLLVLLGVPVLAFLVAATRTRVRVVGGRLEAGGRSVPVTSLGELHPLPAAATRRRLGREADPRAVVVHRFWVRTALLAATAGAGSPVPYWLVSTRRPERLAAAITAARAAAAV